MKGKTKTQKQITKEATAFGAAGGKAIFKKIGKKGMSELAMRRWHPELFRGKGQKAK